MYDLYVENCRKENEDPISLSYYRNVFNTDFNIGFHKPKSDRCDRCEAYKVSKAQAEQITEEVEAAQKHHIAEKTFMHSDRNADRQNPVKFVVCFDLENVNIAKGGNQFLFLQETIDIIQPYCSYFNQMWLLRNMDRVAIR